MISSKRGWVAVYDLDGTLIPGNSFHEWLRSILFFRLASVRSPSGVVMWCRTVVSIILRIVGIYKHADMKRAVQTAWMRAGTRQSRAGDMQGLAGTLAGTVLPDLLESLTLFKSCGVPTVISTAAPIEYASPFATSLGVEAVVATASPGSGWRENIREVKARNTRDTLDKMSLLDRNIVFFTDHIDDLPLMIQADYVVWCGKNGTVPRDVTAKGRAHVVTLDTLRRFLDDQIAHCDGARNE